MGFALTSVLPAWLRRTVGGAAEQSSHWQAFRQAARATDYYNGTAFVRDRVVELPEFYREHARFFNAEAPPPAPAPLEACWDPLPKAVAVKPWFRVLPPVETALDTASEGKAWDVVAAPAPVLAELAQLLPPPGYGVIAFTGIGQPPLESGLRDLLWEAWRTPVFEQYRGFQGELLAYGCEAFEGLHYDPARAIWEERDNGELLVTSLLNLRHPVWRLATGRCGRVEQAECACGSSLPRIV